MNLFTVVLGILALVGVFAYAQTFVRKKPEVALDDGARQPRPDPTVQSRFNSVFLVSNKRKAEIVRYYGGGSRVSEEQAMEAAMRDREADERRWD